MAARKRKKPPPRRATRSLAGSASFAAASEARSRASSGRHPRDRADRDRHLPRRRRLLPLVRWHGRRGRDHRLPVPARGARLRGAGGARARPGRCSWRASCRPPARPLRAGVICLTAALTLALAAGTLGLGPGMLHGLELLGHPRCSRQRGGVLGQGELWVSMHLISTVGANVLAVFLLIAGVILLTGRGRRDLRERGQALDRRARRRRVVRRPSQARPPLRASASVSANASRCSRPSPTRPSSSSARPTSRRPRRWTTTPTSPSSCTWSRRPSRRPTSCRSPRPNTSTSRPIRADLTPQGRYRASVTDDPDFAWRVPSARVPGAGDRRRGQARHRGAGADRADAARGPRALRDRREADRPHHGPPHHPLRAAAGTGHQGREGRAAEGRPRVRAGGDRHPDPCADPRQAGGRGRGAQRAPADRPPRRRLPGSAERLVAADGVARQGHRRPRDRRRPGEDAPPAGRRNDRRRQVGVRQRDAVVDPAARHAARGPVRAGRPQAGRAQPLRVDPASADPGDHEPANGRQRAPEPRQGDGAALRDHVAGADSLTARAQPRPREARTSRTCRTSCA